MKPCGFPGCPALESRWGMCAVHARGYRVHDGGKPLQCRNCLKAIEQDEWFIERNGRVVHGAPCKAVHPHQLHNFARRY